MGACCLAVVGPPLPQAVHEGTGEGVPPGRGRGRVPGEQEPERGQEGRQTRDVLPVIRSLPPGSGPSQEGQRLACVCVSVCVYDTTSVCRACA